MATPVQELAICGQDPPQIYNYSGTGAGALNASVPLVEIPVVDVGRLISSPSTDSEELQKLCSALSSWGCFQVLLKIEELNKILLKAMAKSLNLEENCFLDQYGGGEEALMTARFNLYPTCPRPDQIIGAKPHADASALTFLLQDKQVGGLQFLNGNEWFRVPIIPDALLVNVGDQVEIMSNGVFKSPVHRVVTNSEKERYSLAVFCIPSSEKEIKPAEGLISETRPALYKKVKDYVSIYFEYYQRGRRPIDAAMI
ncbi:Jasmonate-induced oxygenase 4 [Linum perenne]